MVWILFTAEEIEVILRHLDPAKGTPALSESTAAELKSAYRAMTGREYTEDENAA